ncbi:unnamed protein product [Rhizophagus irregularis]|nr:unnamed protein product [Rhizophagus irregularis]
MLLKDVGDNCDDDDDDGGCGGDDRDDDDYLRFHAQFCLAWKSLVHRLSQQLFGNPGAVSGDQIFQFLFV